MQGRLLQAAVVSTKGVLLVGGTSFSFCERCVISAFLKEIIRNYLDIAKTSILLGNIIFVQIGLTSIFDFFYLLQVLAHKETTAGTLVWYHMVWY